MKVVALLGSPRPGSNSTAIARRVLQTAAEGGAETCAFELNRLTYRGCQACYACKTGRDDCILNDDLREVLATVRDADAVVLASPVYYGEVTSQLKGFIDRTFSYLTPDYRTSPQPSRLAPKRLVFVLTQGRDDEAAFADIYPRYEMFLKWLGFTETRLIRAWGIGPGAGCAVVEDSLRQADEAARQLLA